jgi:hypothetical protein
MFNVRSRAGVVAVTAGATLLVALPVVSLGAVPAVDHLPGHANETARDVVTSAPKPSLPAHAQAPAVRPAPRAQTPANSNSAPSRSTRAPGSTPADGHSRAPQHSSQSRSRGHSRAPARGHAGGSPQEAGGSPQGEAAGQDDQAPHASDKKRKATDKETKAAPDSGDETVSGLATDVEIADGSAAAPRDASPATLPFTGLQLALMGMFGLMAVAGGALLRRGVRDRRA